MYSSQRAWAKVKFFYRCFVSLKEFFLGIMPIKKRKRPARNPRTGRLLCARCVMKKLIYKIIGTINFSNGTFTYCTSQNSKPHAWPHRPT